MPVAHGLSMISCVCVGIAGCLLFRTTQQDPSVRYVLHALEAIVTAAVPHDFQH